MSLSRTYTAGVMQGQDLRATFSQFTPQTAGTFQDPFRFASIGSCLVRAGSAEAIGPAPGTGLDAGPQIVVHGPNGDNTLGQLWYAPGQYYGTSSEPGGVGVGPAAYTVTGTGGTQVGAFSLNLDDPAALTGPIRMTSPPCSGLPI
jgi:hypothetical protein